MDTEMVTPTAVAAMATIIVEPVKRSSMMISFQSRIELSVQRPQRARTGDHRHKDQETIFCLAM
jgi:hypothetical protein